MALQSATDENKNEKIYYSRSRGINGIHDGTLILPSLKENDVVSTNLFGVELIIMIRNIFDLRDDCVTVIPYYTDGVLYKLLKELNNANNDENYPPRNNTISEIKSNIEGILKFVLYAYNRNDEKLENDFEKIASLCPNEGSLVLPTFGALNGVMYYKIASRIFYGLISCLETEGSALRKLKRIIITTKFDENQDGSSMRVIKHLFNLITIHKKSINEPECLICCCMKRSVILGCGHRIACERCVFDIKKTMGVCPLCKIPITILYPCYTVTDMSDVSCGDGHIKSGKIFVPCGHYNALCIRCEDNYIKSKKCPICSENVIACVKLFQ